MSGAVLVNAAFRGQRITGQQRYATEIADRLQVRGGFDEVGPSGAWAGSSAREWAWVLARLPRVARDATVLSLTARAPLHSRQVLVVHDLFVLTNPEWYSRSYVLTHAPVLRAQLKRAAAVIAVSEPVAMQVRERFGGEVVVAPNAPSSVFSTPDPEADAGVLDVHGLRPNEYLLSVGNMDPRKNLPFLARAYGMLPELTRREVPLVVVGGGAAIYRDQQITWPVGTIDAGYVTDDELRALYAGARAVVFPSRAEGFGLPLVEASAAGTRRFVISDLPAFRWICGDAADYVDPLSVESIADGLRRAVEDPQGSARLESGRFDLPGRFDWDASAAAVGDVCEWVAA